MIDNKLIFTYREKDNTLIEVQSTIAGNLMEIDVYGTEDYYGHFVLVTSD